MPIIKPTIKSKRIQARYYLEEDLLNEIKAYCAWASVERIDDYMGQAARIVLRKDKEWRQYKQSEMIKKKSGGDLAKLSVAGEDQSGYY